MHLKGVHITVEAAVCKTLPVSVLLGTDMKVLYELIKQSWVESD